MASAASRSARRSARVSISARRAAASSFKASAFSVPTWSNGVAFASMPTEAARPGDSAAAAKKPTSRSNCPTVSKTKSPPGTCLATPTDLCIAVQLVLRAKESVASPVWSAMSLPGTHWATCIAVDKPASTARNPSDTAALAVRISNETTEPANFATVDAQLTPQEPANSAREPPGNHRMAAFKSSTGSTDRGPATAEVGVPAEELGTPVTSGVQSAPPDMPTPAPSPLLPADPAAPPGGEAPRRSLANGANPLSGTPRTSEGIASSSVLALSFTLGRRRGRKRVLWRRSVPRRV
mmetsp:Transcript_123732/g.357905  ORF Transcript_123732/g.357905 Transcript_123732/m.357905 type:complete len:295 (+) Transcript_123732:646-1530(+)